MKRKIEKTLKGLIAILVAMSLWGCSPYIEVSQPDNTDTFPGVDKAPQEEIISMESAPVLNYTAPLQVPGILVAQIGYSKTGDKIVILQGSRLPKEYSICEKESGRKVYIGQVEQAQTQDAQSDTLVGYGDFSSFQTEGEYYIECDYLGRSYNFQIKEGIHTGLMEELLGTLDDRPILEAEQGKVVSEGDIITQCRELCAILLAVELFPDSQLNKINGLENKTPDVLEYAVV